MVEDFSIQFDALHLRATGVVLKFRHPATTSYHAKTARIEVVARVTFRATKTSRGTRAQFLFTRVSCAATVV